MNKPTDTTASEALSTPNLLESLSEAEKSSAPAEPLPATPLLESKAMNVTDSMERLADGVVKLAPAFLTLLAFWLAVQGQYFFDLEPIDTFNLRHGMIRFALGALFLLLARLLYRFPTSVGRTLLEPSPIKAGLEPLTELFSPVRVVMTMLALFLMAYVLTGLAQINPAEPNISSFTAYFWGWLLACALVTVPWLYSPEVSRVGEPSSVERIASRLINGMVTYRWELLAISLITLLATWLRLSDLPNAPFTINGHEGSIGLEVQAVLKGELKNPFGLIWGTHSSLVAFVLALPARFMGLSLASLRLMHALISILAIPALFLLSRLISNKWIALAAAFFLATFPMHIHYSRVAVGANIWDSFFYTATLAAFVWGIRSESNQFWPFALAGLVGGLGQFTHTGARFLPLLLIVFIAYLSLWHIKLLQRKWTAILVMTLVFIVVASPHYLYLSRFPDEANTQLNQISILQNGWLKAEVERRDESRALILWDQFRHALLGFAYYDDNSDTWQPGTPLAPTLFSIGLFLALMVSLRRRHEPAMILMHFWFWGLILTAGMLTLQPPISNRLVGLTPVLCFFVALGWDAVARALAPSLALGADTAAEGLMGRGGAPTDKGASRSLSHLAFFVILASFTGYTGVSAQQAYLADNNYGGTNALVATHIGYELATYPVDTTLIMLAAPRIWSDISPLAFLTPNYARQDIAEPLSAPDAVETSLPPNGDLMIVVLPERAGEMGFILQTFPNGKMREVYDQKKNELIYYEIIIDR